MNYTKQDPRFSGMDLDEETNIPDLKKWVKERQLEGLVDEEHGGIIGYINRAHIQSLVERLNTCAGNFRTIIELQFYDGWTLERVDYYDTQKDGRKGFNEIMKKKAPLELSQGLPCFCRVRMEELKHDNRWKNKSATMCITVLAGYFKLNA